MEMHPTRTLTTSSNTKTGTKEASLYTRLLSIKHPKVLIIQLLGHWIKEGRGIGEVKSDLQNIIKRFIKIKRFQHALQISEWMTDKSSLEISLRDVAVQLELISKVHGVEQAEEYFNYLPNTSKHIQVYDALLKCYADAKLFEKAKAIKQKMSDLGYDSTLSYNVMLNLYSHMRKYKEIDSLIKEMEEKAITFDKLSYTIRLNAYANDFELHRMEKLLMEMEADPLVTVYWNTYAVVANGYIQAGDMEKALESLRKSEHLIRAKTRLPYEVLLTLYARVGNKDEVYRIWNLLKNKEKLLNASYLCMISSLAILDDLDGGEKIFEEWKAKRLNFDYRLSDLLITAYCKKGLMGKAESFVQRLIESGKEPNACTWSRLALGYHTDNQMEKAVEALKKAILSSHPSWKPILSTVVSCLEYLKGKGDFYTADQIKNSLVKQGLDYSDIYENTKEENSEFK